MTHQWFGNPKVIILIPLLLSLLFAVACGGTAAEPIIVEKEVIKEVVKEVVVEKEVVKEVPVEVVVEKEVVKEVVVERIVLATPAPTFTPLPQSAQIKIVEDIINLGLKEMGPIQGIGDPYILGSPRVGRANVTIFETLVVSAPNGDLVPRLARDWSTSADGLTWTFDMEKGVAFHDGYGEMTAEDVVWSFTRASDEGSKFGRAAPLRSLVRGDNSMEVVDDHTFKVINTRPRFDLLFTTRSPYAAGVSVHSKKAFDDGKLDEPKGTGPWRFVESRTGEFWKMEAVEDHWRKTPFFRGLVLWEIPEESTRLAGFQTGALDTGEISLVSLEELRKVEGMKFNKAEEGAQFGFHLQGQFYSEDRPAYKPDVFPWVSSNSDINSPEWEKARKVRLAMAIAIDRQAIVDTLVAGEGRPQHYWMDAGHSVYDPLKAENPEPFKYDPERAKQLLAEAGYAKGFEIPMVCYTRGVPSEIPACEAVGTMWEAIGLNTKITKGTYGSIRPLIFARKLEMIQGHGRMGTYPEPMALWPNSIYTKGGWNAGFEHPIIDKLMDKAFSEVNLEDRFETSREIQKFLRDNVTHIPVYAVNIIFPVGKKIDVWPILGGDKGFINSMEFIQPRSK